MPAPLPPPATTREKAELCEALLPVLAALHGELRSAALRRPNRPASAAARELACRLGDDVARLLRGEPGERYLDAAAITGTIDQAGLVLVLAARLAALEAFRARYCGWHADKARFGWRLAAADGAVEIVALTVPEKPRPGSAPAPDKQPVTPVAELRNALARRLEAGLIRQRYGPPPASSSRSRRRARQRQNQNASGKPARQGIQPPE